MYTISKTTTQGSKTPLHGLIPIVQTENPLSTAMVRWKSEDKNMKIHEKLRITEFGRQKNIFIN
jgi:hypothetical protein